MVNPHEQEYSSFVESHGPLVWRTLCRLLRAGDDGIEDCFQETFLEFLRHGGGSRPDAIENPAGLLVRIATRRVIDRIRRRSRQRKNLQGLGEREPASSPGDDPASVAAGNELADALREALESLPEQQSAVFVMTQFEQMSHEEVSAALGVSLNHVAVLLFRARAALQVQGKLSRIIAAQDARK